MRLLEINELMNDEKLIEMNALRCIYLT